MNGAAIFFLPKQIRTIVKNFYYGERRPSNRTMTSPKNGEKMFFIVSWRVLNILPLVKTRFNWGNEMARRFQNFLSRRNSNRIKTETIFEMPEVTEFIFISIKFRPPLFQIKRPLTTWNNRLMERAWARAFEVEPQLSLNVAKLTKVSSLTELCFELYK